MEKERIYKAIAAVSIILLFVATLPAAFSNSNKIEQAKTSAKEVLDRASKICSSDCKDYPSDWVSEDKRAEAEIYCMSQCSNDMKIIRDSVSEASSIKFENQYMLKVAQLYCLLGLRCYAVEIKDFIQNYQP